MKRNNAEPWWLNLIPGIFGAEPDPPDPDKKEEEEEDEDGEEGEEDKGKKDEDNEGLLKALRAERKSRRNLEKEVKALRQGKQELDAKDQTEVDKAKKAATQATEKTNKLAIRLREQAINNAILKVAAGLQFRDMDDALKLLDREDIDVEQDDDDPADISVDEKTVKTALEALAKKKPHLIQVEGDSQPSGSKFGGSKKEVKTDEEAETKRLTDLYPALRLSGRGPKQ